MFDDPEGPIEHFSWGSFVINGQEHSPTAGVGKDIRLIGDDVSAWSERQGHRLKKSMITGIYNSDIDVLVLGLGVHGRIKCPGKVRREIKQHGLTLIAEPTPEACRVYNEQYRAGKNVALLAHGTC
jgi:hypothetical protein